MKKMILMLCMCLPLCLSAKPNFVSSLYMADKPNYKATEELSMIGEFGLLVANGNTNTSTIKAKIDANQELEKWSYQFIGDSLYKQSKKQVNDERVNVTSAQKLFLSLQTDYKLLNPDNRIFVYAEYEKKRFSGFRYQAAFAAGWSSRLWRNQSSELKYSIGPGYAISEIDKNSKKEETKGLITRAAMEYKRKFFHKATFRQFLSTEAAKDFTKTKSETSLSAKLNGALAMKLSFVVNLDTSVAEEKDELDTQTVVTLVYQFF